MHESQVLELIRALPKDQSTKNFKAVVTEGASVSGKNEIFDVCIWRNHDGQYKLQWERNGQPKLPELNPVARKLAIEMLDNRTTFLTSGVRGNMLSPELVVEHIKILTHLGIEFAL